MSDYSSLCYPLAKYIFVTGGVMSGIGKGVIAASIGKILQVRGLKVTAAKVDPYLNYDAGTMNPYIHGEVFVTEDGGETDMDIGTYERFLDINVPKSHNITTGQIYSSVIERERRGDFLGKCVQIIPHITDEIKDRLRTISYEGADVLIVELEELLATLNHSHILRRHGNSGSTRESGMSSMSTSPLSRCWMLWVSRRPSPRSIVCRSLDA